MTNPNQTKVNPKDADFLVPEEVLNQISKYYPETAVIADEVKAMFIAAEARGVPVNISGVLSTLCALGTGEIRTSAILEQLEKAKSAMSVVGIENCNDATAEKPGKNGL
jgi:hypothetical protein